MADTDAARIGDVKGGLEAAKIDANRRLRRDGSNVDMTPEQAASFRAAIGAGSGGGGGGDMLAANNLSEVDPPQARENLGVYSTGEVDALIDGAGSVDFSGAAFNLSAVSTAALSAAISAVKTNTADATFLFIGDSITFGAYAGSDTAPTPGAYENAFVARLARATADILPSSTHVRAGDGDAGAALIDASDPSISIGDWSIAPGATMGGKYFMAPSDGAAMSVTSDMPWDQFELIYVRAGAAEALNVGSITLTGPSAETASVDAKAGSGTSAARLTLNRATPAAGAVTFTAGLDAGEVFYVIGWVFRNTKARGAHFVNAGIRAANTGTSNATPLGLTRRVANDYVMLAAINGVWKPHLTFIMPGVNDARLGGLNPGIATFKANVQLLINESRLTGSVVLLVPPAFAPSQEGPVPFSDYRTALYELAASNSLALVDMQKVLGTYAESVANGTQQDDLHPNSAGHELMAQALVQVIRAAQGPVVPTFATVAEVRAGKTGGKIVAPDAAAAAMAPVPLTDAATVAVNLDTGPNFTLTTTAGVGVGRTIGLPTNGNPGQYYTIRVTADAAGRTVAWNTAFKWPGGTVQAIANTAGAITEVAFKMISSSRFDVVGFVKDIR